MAYYLSVILVLSTLCFYNAFGQNFIIVDETQASVSSEKYPLLRVVTSLKNDGFALLRITNLLSLTDPKYIQDFRGHKCMLFVYGWLDQTVKFENNGADIGFNNAFENFVTSNLAGPGDDLLVLNWTAYNQDDYFTVINRLQPLAIEIGDQIFNMASLDYPIDLSTWRFVGFSLGAHLVGLIARRIKERSNGRFIVPRVTALDPAGPFLNYPIISWIFPHLEKTDAQFVDVIHTNAGGFGSGWSIGHIDFWPNFGKNQPGCPRNNGLDFLFRPQNLCSHYRSVLLYSDQLYWYSVAGKALFPAVRCTRNILNQLQCSTDRNLMGYRADPTAPNGDYYLITGDDFNDPNLGEAGAAPFLTGKLVTEESFGFQ